MGRRCGLTCTRHAKVIRRRDGNRNDIAEGGCYHRGSERYGFATGRGLAERGWNIVLADVEESRLAAAVRELGTISQAIGVSTDVRDYDAVQALAEGAYEHFGHVDMVFNNAGVATSGEIAEMTHDDWSGS